MPLQESGGRRRLIPGQSWEPVSEIVIVMTCPVLIRKGKKIPGNVFKVLTEELEAAKEMKDILAVGGPRAAMARNMYGISLDSHSTVGGQRFNEGHFAKKR